MKKNYILILIIMMTGILMYGCKGDVRINCNNETDYQMWITGDSEERIDAHEQKSVSVKNGGCINFLAVSPKGTTVVVKDWGLHCYESDNSFTFYPF